MALNRSGIVLIALLSLWKSIQRKSCPRVQRKSAPGKRYIRPTGAVVQADRECREGDHQSGDRRDHFTGVCFEAEGEGEGESQTDHFAVEK